MGKDRNRKTLRETDGTGLEVPTSSTFPKALFGVVSNEFGFEVDFVQIAPSGVIFLAGWTDDRASNLQQVHIRGQGWSKRIDSRHLGRHRHPGYDGGTVTAQQRFFGFWALSVHDRTLINGHLCSVEIVLNDGISKSVDVPVAFTAAEDLKASFAKFWNNLGDADRYPPTDLTYLEQALKRPIVNAEIVMPKHNIETITTSDEGGVFVNGWIDDTTDRLEVLRISGSDGQIVLPGAALARTYREDVQTALAVAGGYRFGFWGFDANSVIQRAGGKVFVDLSMGSGAQRRHEILLQNVDQIELRNTALTYLASARHLGNPQLEAVAGLESYIGSQIIDFNSRLSRKIASQPYVERFGRRSKKYKGSMVICLYGKPEYLFLQNSLFSNRPGIEDYEFIYICNSPELAEPLLRDARISMCAYDIDQTVAILPGNAGFGGANNAAAQLAQSDRILVINPDVFPYAQDWAKKHTDIVEQLPREQTDIFGGTLYYDDGSLMHGGMYFEADRGISMDQSKFKSVKFLRVEHYGKGAPPLGTRFVQSRPVPAVTGAFISLNRKWFENIGGFDEDYVFGHYEDADLCLRVWKEACILGYTTSNSGIWRVRVHTDFPYTKGRRS